MKELELQLIVQYQEETQEREGRYVSFSEAVSLWMAEQLKDMITEEV